MRCILYTSNFIAAFIWKFVTSYIKYCGRLERPDITQGSRFLFFKSSDLPDVTVHIYSAIHLYTNKRVVQTQTDNVDTSTNTQAESDR